MIETSLEQGSDTRIFFLSALGSILLHALLMAGLANMPQPTIEKNELPTVQVNLVAAPEVLQSSTPETPPPPQPRVVIPNTPPPPMPLKRPHRSQPTIANLRASLAPTPPVKPVLTPPIPAKSILQDTRASQALKSRKLMKMRVPMQTQQTSPSLSTKATRINSQNPVVPPLPTMRKEPLAARSLPTPPTFTTPQTIKATPPAATGPSVTRPTIITSSRPAYPRVARESGWEGTVIVRTLIDTNGRPSQVKIRKSCGHQTLDQAAQDAIQRWTFQPAKDGNIPITKWVDIPVKFDLNS